MNLVEIEYNQKITNINEELKNTQGNLINQNSQLKKVK